MTLSCEHLDHLLFEGDAASLAAAERHANECPGCRAKLDDWNDISSVAKTMRGEWPSDLLWPRIERSLRNERRRLSSPWLRIAAALILTIGLGAGVWLTAHVRAQREFDRDILRVAALDEVEKAEASHEAAIARLETIAAPKLDDAATPLLISYKEKLMLLDDAIAECQTNIDRNRQNAHLRKQLLAMYSEKQRTLQDVLREENHVQNP